MINFSKQLVFKEKKSEINTDEIYGSQSSLYGEKVYSEKVSDRGLSFTQMHLMYIANTWVRVCVDRIVERANNIKPMIKPVRKKSGYKYGGHEIPDSTKRHIEKVEKLFLKPNLQYETFDNIKKKVMRDILVYDAGALEKVQEYDLISDERNFELFSVPGDSIKLNVNKKGLFNLDEAYIQVDDAGKHLHSWNIDQIIYYMLNPQSKKVYGLSPLESLIQTVTAELYASKYNLDFFNNNATPRFAVLMEKLGIGQGAPTVKRFREFWDSELKGNPHRPIIIGTEDGSIKFEKVGLSNEEMQFQQYSAWLLVKIMAMYKLQPVIMGVHLGDNYSKMSSEEQVKQFKVDAVQPMLKSFYGNINRQIIHDDKGFDFKDIYVDYDLELEDKKIEAEYQEKYIRSGAITINDIRVLTLGMNPVPWGDVPYLQNNLVPFGQGKNGQSVPQSPNQTVNDMPKELIMKIISDDSKNPVGWEDMEISQRLEMVTQLIKDREKMLSKTFIIPNKYKVD